MPGRLSRFNFVCSSFWERLTSWLGSFATPDSTTVTRRWRLYFRRMGKGKFCKQGRSSSHSTVELIDVLTTSACQPHDGPGADARSVPTRATHVPQHAGIALLLANCSLPCLLGAGDLSVSSQRFFRGRLKFLPVEESARGRERKVSTVNFPSSTTGGCWHRR
jgi:hypothetical protein